MWVIFVGGVLSAGGLASFDLTSSFRMSGRSTYCPQSSSYDERRSTSWIFPQEDFSKPRSCEKCEFFWELQRFKRSDLGSFSHWWEVGKAQMWVFCQQCTSHSAVPG